MWKKVKHIDTDKLILLLSAMFIFFGCSKIKSYRLGDAVARVGEKALYADEVSMATIDANSSEDSLRLAEEYIKKWATDIVLSEKARSESKNSKQIEALVEQYRRSLYINDWEQTVIEEDMNKQVSQEELQAYYDSHTDEFVLREPLLKGILLIVPQDAPDRRKLPLWLKDPTIENLEKIEKYAYQFASAYDLSLEQWISWYSLTSYIPTLDKKKLQINQVIEKTDSANAYYFFVSDMLKEKDAMPLSFATPYIESAILQNRKQKYLEDRRKQLFQQSVKRGKILIEN
ncbi:MAG: peptidyl-prolyl cis-trans isomerase [Paludibacteraceae bacterium]|nr:peptidyl-prolyl cis-trans isomerase [Paludibacteraceae bacterium]